MSSSADLTRRHFRDWHSSSGSVSGGAVRGGEEGGGRYAGSLALGGDYGERPGPASFSPAKSDGKSVGGGGGGGGGGSRSEVVKVLLRKDSGLRSSLDEAEATDAADDDVLLSVIRDIDRGSLGRGLPALPAAPPPPPPLSASPKIDPPEVPPKSSGVRKQASSGALHARHHSNLGKNKQVWRDCRSAAARPATLS